MNAVVESPEVLVFTDSAAGKVKESVGIVPFAVLSRWGRRYNRRADNEENARRTP